jgi:hemoglobin
MYHAHKGLHLDTAQFDALVEDLELAMDKYDIPFRTQNRLLAILAPMERDVVTR